MRIISPETLDRFRGPGRCSWCGKSCSTTEGHHWRSRGAGRLDIRINLLRLGSSLTFECPCHGILQGKKEHEAKVIELIAIREKTTPEAVETVVNMLLRLPKEPRPWQFAKEMEDMAYDSWSLAVKVFEEEGIEWEGP